MRKLSLILAALVLSTFLAFISPVFAQTAVVVPNDLTDMSGNSGSGVPFDCANAGFPSTRFQQVYLGEQFPQPGLIDKISFRLTNVLGNEPGFGPTTLPDVLIQLSTTHAQPGALSNTFDDNVGPDVKTVFSRDLTLSAPDCNEIFPQPCPFVIMISLRRPFFYNPEDGNLLLDIRIPECGQTAAFDSTTTMPSIVSWAFSSDVASGEATQNRGSGLVTQFRISEAPLPENVPTISEWGLIAMAGILGIIGFMVIRRRKATA